MRRYRGPRERLNTMFIDHSLNDYACKTVFRMIFGMRKVADKHIKNFFREESFCQLVGVNEIEDDNKTKPNKADMWSILEQRFDASVRLESYGCRGAHVAGGRNLFRT